MEKHGQTELQDPPSARTERPGRPATDDWTHGQGEPQRQSSLQRADQEDGTHRSWAGPLVCVVLLALAVSAFFVVRRYLAAQNANTAPKPHATPVMAATAHIGDMPIYFTGLGSVTPLNSVTLHTRVDGELDSVKYVEGQKVQLGQLLAQIDPRPYQVQLTQAQGQLIKDQAQLAEAQLDLKRYQDAAGSFTQQQIDTQAALVKQLEGAVKTDQGAIDSANLELIYCQITSPLDGTIGLRLVDPGNIVHAADTNGLAVITQLQPITVIFSLPEENIPQILKAKAKNPKLDVEAYTPDMKWLASGSLLALDNQVDSTTATVRLKAIFPNADNLLFPNEFVNARLLVDVRKGVVIAPSAAVQRSPDGTFAYVVKATPPDKAEPTTAPAGAPLAPAQAAASSEPAAGQKEGGAHGARQGPPPIAGTVEMRTITVGSSEADQTIIESGLQPGDIVVTEGVDKLEAGAAVMAQVQQPENGATTQPAQAGGHTHRQGHKPQQ
jgi:multidrug efflux system membrane fusion protein